MSMGRLADLLGVEPCTATRRIRHLEQNKCVDRYQLTAWWTRPAWATHTQTVGTSGCPMRQPAQPDECQDNPYPDAEWRAKQRATTRSRRQQALDAQTPSEEANST